MQDDNRRASRVTVAAIASLETRGTLNANNQALGTVRNISSSGIGLETGQPPIVGQTVFLRLAIGDEVHQIKTRATRVTRFANSNFYDVGLDWSVCATNEIAFLDEVLKTVAQQPLA